MHLQGRGGTRQHTCAPHYVAATHGGGSAVRTRRGYTDRRAGAHCCNASGDDNATAFLATRNEPPPLPLPPPLSPPPPLPPPRSRAGSAQCGALPHGALQRQG
eukprot:TRINITY_DN1203_c3_g2_i2.p3 TRINITY_DN1203_c3_g2~~TRINITY_DN1203_c3_g2_i2.p3  ORF type:complete len:103 (+),score=29.49 TRINITY_DN1203_c3_g2_i2:327-635(+)